METVGYLILRILFAYIAVRMAENRNRSIIGWGLFAFFISPLLTWIILAILGDNSEKLY